MTVPGTRNNCCLGCGYSYKNIKVSCGDIIFLIMAIVLIILGSLLVSGIFSGSRMMGVILPFGTAIEGGATIALGAIIMAVIFSRIFSHRFRNVCSVQ